MINRCIVPVLCLALVLGSAAGSSFLNLYAQHQNSNQKHQRDYTLDELKNAHYFSEYLEKNDLEGARTNGLVNLESEKILGSKATHDFKSYAGYFTVDKQCNSNLYTWFFQNKVRTLFLRSTSFLLIRHLKADCLNQPNLATSPQCSFGPPERIKKLISTFFVCPPPRMHRLRFCCGCKVLLQIQAHPLFSLIVNF